MTTHELEQFIERAWNDPQRPPTQIPVEVTQYALERGRRVRSCELKRMLAAIGSRVREWFGVGARENRAAGRSLDGASPC